MAYGIQNLRRSTVFDQLTPGARGYNEYSDDNEVIRAPDGQPLERNEYEPSDTRVLRPDGTPLEEPPSGLAKIADVSVNPNKPNEQERLKGYLDTIGGAYTPDYTSRNRNDRLLDDAPTRGQPTNWDRTAAILMSLGQKDALGIQERVLQAPYYQKAEEFKLKTEPFYKAAELENRQNINERTLLTNAATTYTAAERNRIAQENNEAKAENERIRAQAYAFKQTHPNWTIKTDGPNVMAYNPQNPSAPPINLGPSGKMSQIDLENLKGEYRVEAARQTGADAMARTQVAGAETYVDPATNQPRVVNPRTGEGMGGGPVRKPTTGGAGSTNTLETRRQEQDAMENAYTGDNATARKYMTGDPRHGFIWKNRPTVTPESLWPGKQEVTEADVAEYDRYRTSVDPNYKPPTKGLGPSTRVLNPDGTESTVPNVTSPSKDINAPQKTTGKDYRLKQNPNNPNEKARSFDGGKTWQKSTDGGRTWR